ncbi:hypothetical protein CBR_g39996 [Chara braunii]|uniref:Uncharacterized protein n=1 Tax=Chara braunii TaxID=69332 RepID=A0A388LSZ2_CHABU|nr:hypothetical protein CBR_g39996 [Chara braunii]|eukprot:GBG85353.1 hypothetical protein CBR_g39996 [Chara braunii]
MAALTSSSRTCSCRSLFLALGTKGLAFLVLLTMATVIGMHASIGHGQVSRSRRLWRSLEMEPSVDMVGSPLPSAMANYPDHRRELLIITATYLDSKLLTLQRDVLDTFPCAGCYIPALLLSPDDSTLFFSQQVTHNRSVIRKLRHTSSTSPPSSSPSQSFTSHDLTDLTSLGGDGRSFASLESLTLEDDLWILAGVSTGGGIWKVNTSSGMTSDFIPNVTSPAYGMVMHTMKPTVFAAVSTSRLLTIPLVEGHLQQSEDSLLLAGGMETGFASPSDRSQVRFNHPRISPRSISSNGTFLYVADTDNSAVRRVATDTGATTNLVLTAFNTSWDVPHFPLSTALTSDDCNLFVVGRVVSDDSIIIRLLSFETPNGRVKFNKTVAIIKDSSLPDVMYPTAQGSVSSPVNSLPAMKESSRLMEPSADMDGSPLPSAMANDPDHRRELLIITATHLDSSLLALQRDVLYNFPCAGCYIPALLLSPDDSTLFFSQQLEQNRSFIIKAHPMSSSSPLLTNLTSLGGDGRSYAAIETSANSRWILASASDGGGIWKVDTALGMKADFIPNVTSPAYGMVIHPITPTIIAAVSPSRLLTIPLVEGPLPYSEESLLLAGGMETGFASPSDRSQVRFNHPRISPRSISSDGNFLYVADTNNLSVRRVATDTGATTNLVLTAFNTSYDVPHFPLSTALTSDDCNLFVAGKVASDDSIIIRLLSFDAPNGRVAFNKTVATIKDSSSASLPDLMSPAMKESSLPMIRPSAVEVVAHHQRSRAGEKYVVGGNINKGTTVLAYLVLFTMATVIAMHASIGHEQVSRSRRLWRSLQMEPSVDMDGSPLPSAMANDPDHRRELLIITATYLDSSLLTLQRDVLDNFPCAGCYIPALLLSPDDSTLFFSQQLEQNRSFIIKAHPMSSSSPLLTNLTSLGDDGRSYAALETSADSRWILASVSDGGGIWKVDSGLEMMTYFIPDVTSPAYGMAIHPITPTIFAAVSPSRLLMIPLIEGPLRYSEESLLLAGGMETGFASSSIGSQVRFNHPRISPRSISSNGAFMYVAVTDNLSVRRVATDTGATTNLVLTAFNTSYDVPHFPLSTALTSDDCNLFVAGRVASDDSIIIRLLSFDAPNGRVRFNKTVARIEDSSSASSPDLMSPAMKESSRLDVAISTTLALYRQAGGCSNPMIRPPTGEVVAHHQRSRVGEKYVVGGKLGNINKVSRSRRLWRSLQMQPLVDMVCSPLPSAMANDAAQRRELLIVSVSFLDSSLLTLQRDVLDNFPCAGCYIPALLVSPDDSTLLFSQQVADNVSVIRKVNLMSSTSPSSSSSSLSSLTALGGNGRSFAALETSEDSRWILASVNDGRGIWKVDTALGMRADFIPNVTSPAYGMVMHTSTPTIFAAVSSSRLMMIPLAEGPLPYSEESLLLAGGMETGFASSSLRSQVQFNHPRISPRSISSNGAFLYVADTDNLSVRRVATDTGATTNLVLTAFDTSYDVPHFPLSTALTSDDCNLFVAGRVASDDSIIIRLLSFDAPNGRVAFNQTVARIKDSSSPDAMYPTTQGSVNSPVHLLPAMKESSRLVLTRMDAYLYLSTPNGHIYEFQVNRSALHKCSAFDPASPPGFNHFSYSSVVTPLTAPSPPSVIDCGLTNGRYKKGKGGGRVKRETETEGLSSDPSRSPGS